MKLVIDIEDKLFFEFSEVMKKSQLKDMSFDEWIESSMDNTILQLTVKNNKNLSSGVIEDKEIGFEKALKTLEELIESNQVDNFPGYTKYLCDIIIKGKKEDE